MKEEEVPQLLSVPAQTRNSTGSYKFIKEIDLSKTVVYVDMWRSHWCTYYNDRAEFITPRINELVQKIRRLNVTTVHISMVIDGYLGASKQRRVGRRAVEMGNVSALNNFHAQQTRYHKDYVPGFKDECWFLEQERYGKYRDNRLTKGIPIASTDVFVSNFREAAMSFVGLGAKTVIVMGQHTNMCLMAVFLYCREVGLDLIIVRDLVDACWVYRNQYRTHPTHVSGNQAVNDYFEAEFGSSVLSYDLMRAIDRFPAERSQPKYEMFTNRAHMFG